MKDFIKQATPSSEILKNLIDWLTHLPVFPLLFTIFPILSLFARNIVFIPFADTVRPLVITLSVMVAFNFLLWAIVRDWAKAGLISSSLICMFYSYGHIENWIKNIHLFDDIDRILFFLKWGWFVIILLLVYFLLRTKMPRQAIVFLNLCGLGLILQPGFAIVSTMIATNPGSIARDEAILSEMRGDKTHFASSIDKPAMLLPDIYFLVLDGYQRPDKLMEYYQLDVSPFIQSLMDSGFFIADQARSNYLSTTYSLNTSLNMLYFHTFPPTLQKVAHYNLQTNYFADYLKSKGYQIVVYDSGTGDSNNQFYDLFISPVTVQTNSNTIRPFETLLLQTTMLQMLFPEETNESNIAGQRQRIAAELDLRRARLDSAFEHLPDYAIDDQPQFLFAHIYSPHIPFLYGQDGKPLDFSSTNTINWYEPAPEDYIQQYGYQVEVINQRILEVVNRILSNSNRPVVILIQSDHGDDHYLDWEAMDSRGVDLRSSILYAVYYSDGDYSDFYPTISSVNTFRNVLNHWFGTTYPLLEDKVMFHAHSVTTRPNVLPRFSDACEVLDVCINK